jgi:hypothetical protein
VYAYFYDFYKHTDSHETHGAMIIMLHAAQADMERAWCTPEKRVGTHKQHIDVYPRVDYIHRFL